LVAVTLYGCCLRLHGYVVRYTRFVTRCWLPVTVDLRLRLRFTLLRCLVTFVYVYTVGLLRYGCVYTHAHYTFTFGWLDWFTRLFGYVLRLVTHGYVARWLHTRCGCTRYTFTTTFTYTGYGWLRLRFTVVWLHGYTRSHTFAHTRLYTVTFTVYVTLVTFVAFVAVCYTVGYVWLLPVTFGYVYLITLFTFTARTFTTVAVTHVTHGWYTRGWLFGYVRVVVYVVDLVTHRLRLRYRLGWLFWLLRLHVVTFCGCIYLHFVVYVCVWFVTLFGCVCTHTHTFGFGLRSRTVTHYTVFYTTPHTLHTVTVYARLRTRLWFYWFTHTRLRAVVHTVTRLVARAFTPGLCGYVTVGAVTHGWFGYTVWLPVTHSLHTVAVTVGYRFTHVWDAVTHTPLHRYGCWWFTRLVTFVVTFTRCLRYVTLPTFRLILLRFVYVRSRYGCWLVGILICCCYVWLRYVTFAVVAFVWLVGLVTFSLFAFVYVLRVVYVVVCLRWLRCPRLRLRCCLIYVVVVAFTRWLVTFGCCCWLFTTFTLFGWDTFTLRYRFGCGYVDCLPLRLVTLRYGWLLDTFYVYTFYGCVRIFARLLRLRWLVCWLLPVGCCYVCVYVVVTLLRLFWVTFVYTFVTLRLHTQFTPRTDRLLHRGLHVQRCCRLDYGCLRAVRLVVTLHGLRLTVYSLHTTRTVWLRTRSGWLRVPAVTFGFTARLPHVYTFTHTHIYTTFSYRFSVTDARYTHGYTFSWTVTPAITVYPSRCTWLHRTLVPLVCTLVTLRTFALVGWLHVTLRLPHVVVYLLVYGWVVYAITRLRFAARLRFTHGWLHTVGLRRVWLPPLHAVTVGYGYVGYTPHTVTDAVYPVGTTVYGFTVYVTRLVTRFTHGLRYRLRLRYVGLHGYVYVRLHLYTHGRLHTFTLHGYTRLLPFGFTFTHGYVYVTFTLFGLGYHVARFVRYTRLRLRCLRLLRCWLHV